MVDYVSPSEEVSAVNDENDATWITVSWLDGDGYGTTGFRFPAIPTAVGIDWDSLTYRVTASADNLFNFAPRAYFGVYLTEENTSMYNNVQLAPVTEVAPGEGPVDRNPWTRRDEFDELILFDNQATYLTALQEGRFAVMLDFPTNGPLVVGQPISVQIHRLYMTYQGLDA